ncbi:hypothetical protein [Thermomonospora umbrina]|uniref:Uncharacterized protein n=1 Tax=Thermomonospora umbrina TaxID=111806 RepID=A0A3D9SKS9_9ACTN|nr:hypothetical protein [Thermomonospora umbrina]REE96542.1 hypothetical protein DFJ69_1979 [Thermomonospora umbrina]
MTDVTSGSATTRLIQPDRVYVGWRYAQVHPDPGPPPRRPRPSEEEGPDPLHQVHPRDRNLLFYRPVKVTAVGTGVGAGLFLVCGVLGLIPWRFAGVGLLACAAVLGITGYSIWQGERVVRARLKQERERYERERDARRRRLFAAQEEHAAAYREWERRRREYDGQREWYPVAVPPGVDRVDVVGGTLAGWSAAVTTMGAARLAVGARLTVLDLSEGAVAHDLVKLAADRGDDPLVWVLPNDLPRLDLTSALTAEALADVLSLAVGAGEDEATTGDLSFDNSILERIISGVFGGTATIPQITAALRALAQVGDPRDDLRRGLLDDEQLARVTTMYGRGATDRIVIRRAWALEAQLRKLERLGVDPVRLPPSRLHVVSMDRRAGVLTNRILGTYVATALTHRIRNAPPARRWEHTVFLCGAEKLRGDVLDRLIDACETTGTGLVLLYRSIPPHVRERLGRRGHAAVGFMRLGNADDARVAAEHIGAGRRLRIAEITDTACAAGDLAPPDPTGAGYASTVAYARVRGDALTDPVWTPLPAPAADDADLVAGISGSTGWGRTIPATERRQSSRELLVEPHRLQELPPTAMIFTHATAGGRRILMVDANPGIITLPTAHSVEFEEFLRQSEQAPEAPSGPSGPPPAFGAPVPEPDTRQALPPAVPTPSWSPEDRPGPAEADPPAPNLGPPPERLDFRPPRRPGKL